MEDPSAQSQAQHVTLADSLEAEIARLEAEIGSASCSTMADVAAPERPLLHHASSQRDYVVDTQTSVTLGVLLPAATPQHSTILAPYNHYPESDDEFSTDMLSYDEVTVEDDEDDQEEHCEDMSRSPIPPSRLQNVGIGTTHPAPTSPYQKNSLGVTATTSSKQTGFNLEMALHAVAKGNAGTVKPPPPVDPAVTVDSTVESTVAPACDPVSAPPVYGDSPLPLEPTDYCAHERIDTNMVNESIESTVYHESIDTAVHHESIDTAVHHESIEPTVHHETPEPTVYDESIDTAVYHESIESTVYHESIDTAVYHESIESTVHHEPVCSVPLETCSTVATPQDDLVSVESLDEAALLEAEIQRMQAEIDAASLALSSSSLAHSSSSLQTTALPKKKLVRKTRKKVKPATDSASVSDSVQSDAPVVESTSTRPRPAFLADIQSRVKPPNLLAAIQSKAASIQPAFTAMEQPEDEPDTVHRNFDDEAAQLQAEIERMQAELAGTAISEPKVVKAVAPPPPARPPMMSLLGAIEQAATKRVQRLEETGGTLLMQEIEPEVAIQDKGPQQLSTSMAEMISQRAAARDKRLADGGEKRMRKVVIKEKDEYKKDFSNIVTDAAAMGRLTRLNEHTVEAVAQEKTPQQEWKSNGLLAIQWRSNHMAVIHEAARAGNEFKLPEQVVSNFVEEETDDWDPDNYGKPISERMRQLLELNGQVGEGQQKVDKLVLGRKEEQGKPDNLLIKPMQAYSNIEDVKLPRRAAPKINPTRNAEKLSKQMKEAVQNGKPMTDVSATVAEIAWARRARLDRPGSMPKVREVCPCPYCGTASPFQTFAYREQDRKHKEAILKHRQEKLRKHEERQRLLEEGEIVTVEAPQYKEEEEEPLDDVERKRRERQRAREETRKLKQALADAEAAVEAAKATEVYCVPAESETKTPAVPYTPDAKATKTAVQSQVDQWAAVAAPAAASPYAQAPPPEEACCKCVIM